LKNASQIKLENLWSRSFMQNDSSLFDAGYIKGSSETAVSPASLINQQTGAHLTTKSSRTPSVVKEFLKDVLKPEELERYGMGKPERIHVRAKLIHGKS
jgi:hypothetical protein